MPSETSISSRNKSPGIKSSDLHQSPHRQTVRCFRDNLPRFGYEPIAHVRSNIVQYPPICPSVSGHPCYPVSLGGPTPNGVIEAKI
ncbi:hypothetical protein IV203_038833 [Nitzschia inconspicua]|uniref:Uncharacterized protein n=1 Tax=Nitzschia inconspicua TaxID=303405 RepID=A0A9K3K3V7_9STRA|nr:hypothetical protein IV203_038833 [Nitzschia inconspicua]